MGCDGSRSGGSSGSDRDFPCIAAYDLAGRGQILVGRSRRCRAGSCSRYREGC